MTCGLPENPTQATQVALDYNSTPLRIDLRGNLVFNHPPSCDMGRSQSLNLPEEVEQPQISPLCLYSQNTVGGLD